MHTHRSAQTVAWELENNVTFAILMRRFVIDSVYSTRKLKNARISHAIGSIITERLDKSVQATQEEITAPK